MRPRISTPISCLALIALLASCSTEQAAPVPEGWLHATILGPEGETYQGTGYFHYNLNLPGSSLPIERPPFFSFYSTGVGSSAGQKFGLTGFVDERLRVDRYSLGWSEDGQTMWNLSYSVERGDSIEYFQAVDGGFRITASSDKGVKGRFSFTGVVEIVCSKEWDFVVEYENGVPQVPCSYRESDSPMIEIEGSFNALPGQPCVTYAEDEPLSHGRMRMPFCVSS
jgi:hypothetical protein